MQRGFYLIYSAIGYVVGLASIGYLAGFLIDFGVPKGINDGEPQAVWLSVVVDACLVLGFGVHHSLTARSTFKRWWTRWVAPTIERATYVYMSAALTFAMVYFWQPIPVTIWRVENPVATTVILAAYAATWLMMVAATFHFGHFGFFGLSQAWDRFRHRPAAAVPFSARYLYSLVRHPISLGWMLVPWLTPHMTVGQLVWAISVMVYVLAATRYEESDLIQELGDDYLTYRTEVPAFLPGKRRIARERTTEVS